ncbi:MAG: helix-turn-helix transcriptional regulator [Candidatus Microthrix sp.]|nr:TetR/AcrR family transcriptional regulator [Candidatus Microthrix sp.]MBK7321608.1 helix-turn-helix transcriptional regulator [Candidatus Microthrix sp.]
MRAGETAADHPVQHVADPDADSFASASLLTLPLPASGVRARREGAPRLLPPSLESEIRLEIPALLSWLSRATGGHEAETLPLLDAAAACIARWGAAKTTAADIAAEAGCSRATLYRRFPGGSNEWLRAVVEREAGEVVAEVLGEVAASRDLVRAIAIGVSGSIGAMWRRPVLARLLEHERELVLPAVLMDRASPIYATLGEVVAPALAHLCDDESAQAIGEWGARLVVARALQPELPGGLAVEDPEVVAHLAATYLLPGMGLPNGGQANGRRGWSDASPSIRPFPTPAPSHSNHHEREAP